MCVLQIIAILLLEYIVQYSYQTENACFSCIVGLHLLNGINILYSNII